MEEALLSGANPNSAKNQTVGFTMIHQAVRSRNSAAVAMLIRFGADANIESLEGSPLQLAAFYGDKKTVKALLRGGADVSAVGREGNTALHLATTGEIAGRTRCR